MTYGQFHKLINKLRFNKLDSEEAKHCAEIIETFVEMCDTTQKSEDCGDIFGTEGWEHWIGLE